MPPFWCFCAQKKISKQPKLLSKMQDLKAFIESFMSKSMTNSFSIKFDCEFLDSQLSYSEIIKILRNLKKSIINYELKGVYERKSNNSVIIYKVN
jgi:hypothetical protein